MPLILYRSLTDKTPIYLFLALLNKRERQVGGGCRQKTDPGDFSGICIADF